MAKASKKQSTGEGIAVYALDMGDQMYGDCLLVTSGKASILIDGGHASDFIGQPGYPSIPKQLETILGPPPFNVSLLVVTHCHSDHIGSLPQLVSAGLLKPIWALVADEKLGFGRTPDQGPSVDADLPPASRGVLAALREEDRSGMDAAALAEFLQDAATLEQRYSEMLNRLSEIGTKVVRYGRDNVDELVGEFAALNLQILGPTVDHLVLCAEAIAKSSEAAKDELSTRFFTDNFMEAVNAYRTLCQAPWDAVALLDRPGKGAAINDQSIVLTIGSGNQKALLAGDMQLAKPEVSGLQPHMTALRKAVAKAGPFNFFKLPHHTSYNGVDFSVLNEVGDPKFLLHTGGRNDGGHPDKKTLTSLTSLQDKIQFARTDRNGLVRFDLAGDFTVEGDLNDFSPNSSRDVQTPEIQEQTLAGPQPEPEPPAEPEFLEFVYVKVPNRPASFTIGGVAITIGGKSDRPFDNGLPPRGKPNLSRGELRLAGGRRLPSLLFVTDRAKLATNIGHGEAVSALRMIESAGHRLVDLQGSSSPNDIVRRNITGCDGVVLLGGYDVVPSRRVDVLDPRLRREVGAKVYDDPDEFIVWSDDIYGDVDGDQLAEIPVSRLPDGRSSQLVLSTLTGAQSAQQGRFGLINQERPFAKSIWPDIEGSEPSLYSGPSVVSGLQAGALAKRHLYFMLHGDHTDGARFWGDMGGVVEAINVSKLPTSGPDIVFAGCCWGALTVNQLAAQRNGPLGVKTPGQSMALSFLRSGARAFIGCTGAHYSPGEGEDCFGAPMHKAFWRRVKSGDGPAQALFNARKAYLAALPHGLTQPHHVAMERKIYAQFTCLGLAW